MEQAKLMDDFIWLKDLNELFDTKTFLIHVKKVKSSVREKDNTFINGDHDDHDNISNDIKHLKNIFE